MARYAGKTPFPVITKDIMSIVDDAVGFQHSDFCEEQFRVINANPYQWKYVRIHSHRRGGYTTAALELLNKYTSSLIVTHSYPAANRLRQFAIENKLVPVCHEEEFYNNITIYDHIVPHERMDENWFLSRRPYERYQLIILDCASMIEAARNNGYRGAIPGMDEFRSRIFMISDLLVELS